MKRFLLEALAGLAALAVGGGAIAQGVVAPASSLAFNAKAANPARLATLRGGSQLADTRIGGQLSDASAQQVMTGSNAVRDGSFAGAAGLTTVIQNSGANVLIQNALTVNVQLK